MWPFLRIIVCQITNNKISNNFPHKINFTMSLNNKGRWTKHNLSFQQAIKECFNTINSQDNNKHRCILLINSNLIILNNNATRPNKISVNNIISSKCIRCIQWISRFILIIKTKTTWCINSQCMDKEDNNSHTLIICLHNIFNNILNNNNNNSNNHVNNKNL